MSARNHTMEMIECARGCRGSKTHKSERGMLIRAQK